MSTAPMSTVPGEPMAAVDCAIRTRAASNKAERGRLHRPAPGRDHLCLTEHVAWACPAPMPGPLAVGQQQPGLRTRPMARATRTLPYLRAAASSLRRSWGRGCPADTAARCRTPPAATPLPEASLAWGSGISSSRSGSRRASVAARVPHGWHPNHSAPRPVNHRPGCQCQVSSPQSPDVTTDPRCSPPPGSSPRAVENR